MRRRISELDLDTGAVAGRSRPRRPYGLHARLRSGGVVLLALLGLLVAACIEIRLPVPGPQPTPSVRAEEIRDARWRRLPVRYCVVPSDQGFVDRERFAELVAEAFERWTVEAASAGECDERGQGNGRNEIGWGRLGGMQGQAPHGGAFAAGFTGQIFRACLGGCPGGAQSEIVEADILIEPRPPRQFRRERCLFSTLLHEAGHFLGVPHLEAPAVMAPATSACPQELTDADLEAIRSLYG